MFGILCNKLSFRLGVSSLLLFILRGGIWQRWIILDSVWELCVHRKIVYGSPDLYHVFDGFGTHWKQIRTAVHGLKRTTCWSFISRRKLLRSKCSAQNLKCSAVQAVIPHKSDITIMSWDFSMDWGNLLCSSGIGSKTQIRFKPAGCRSGSCFSFITFGGILLKMKMWCRFSSEPRKF